MCDCVHFNFFALSTKKYVLRTILNHVRSTVGRISWFVPSTFERLPVYQAKIVQKFKKANIDITAAEGDKVVPILLPLLQQQIKWPVLR